MKTNADLIYRVNNLETINLSIGQQLFIPSSPPPLPSIVKPRHHRVKYGASSRSIPSFPPKGTAVGQNKVADKIALNGTTRVAFGDKNYAGAVPLAHARRRRRHPGRRCGSGTHPSGFIVPTDEMDEIFLLVSRGTPVTIQ